MHAVQGGESDPVSEALRVHLGRVEARRESLAKEWIIAAIRDSPLADIDQLPTSWAAHELPDLITEVLAATCEGDSPEIRGKARKLAMGLGALRPGLTPTRLAKEIAHLQQEMMRLVHLELDGEGSDTQAAAIGRLGYVFGSLSGIAHEQLSGSLSPDEEFRRGLSRPGRLEHRISQLMEGYRRHGHPFAVTLFDVEGPGSDRVDLVARELRDRIRSLDETFRLDDNELCVLAPFHGSDDAVQMAERLANRLSELEEREGWQLTVSAGVAACPEHADDGSRLLRMADTAMWRARATGRPVAVAALQD